MADKRRKTVSVAFNDDHASLSLYTAPDSFGNQSVAETVILHASSVHASLAEVQVDVHFLPAFLSHLPNWLLYLFRGIRGIFARGWLGHILFCVRSISF